ncbi:SRPBCC domain-containing protein [Paenibacillus antri]|uniref:SRPBCC domain-containing protein n=1 Tax=Paenibacillus antri TaxID=2582848 RepID=A0A5R9GBE8_9BACL|nr:SRPBCC domain-containing protein [Paenibacillus antri]TLS50688.1 SRPBCC domain-containing protein [Paenibacillus antri]
MTNAVTTSVAEKEFTLVRTFEAPRELVFEAFTNPEHLSRWWAPYPYTIPTCRIDLRPGGIWHYAMRSPEGEEHWSRAVYHEIVRPERVVYAATFADEHANPVGGIPEHIGTLLFDEYDGRTTLTVRIQTATPVDAKTLLEMGMAEGLMMGLNQLEAVLARLRG